MGPMTAKPHEFFINIVRKMQKWLDDDGCLIDPVVQRETQYGTAYYARCAAAAYRLSGDKDFLQSAQLSLKQTTRHLLGQGGPTVAVLKTGFLIPKTFADFMWPPAIKAGLDLGEVLDSAVKEGLAQVQIEAVARKKPPTNWAAVWLSGEQLASRYLKRISSVDIDRHLKIFFETRADPKDGFYHEPGHSHSYDLFARLHMGALLYSGYEGRYREQLIELESKGVRRNLAWQLSDGSLPSAHRSSGQTWTDGALLALFSRQLSDDCPINWTADERQQISCAAWRAYASMTRWVRPDGTLSPVHNTFGSHDRVGYQGYTFDANYAALALGFLADALVVPEWQQRPDNLGRQRGVEMDAKRQRGIIHSKNISLQVNALPSAQFDYLGINDISFGTGSRLSFCSAPGLSAHPVDASRSHRYGIGVGTDLQSSVNQLTHSVHEFKQIGENVLSLCIQIQGSDLIIRESYEVFDDYVRLTFKSEGSQGFNYLYVPCPYDFGNLPVEIKAEDNGLSLSTNNELLELKISEESFRVDILPIGMTSRRARYSLALITFGQSLNQLAVTISHSFLKQKQGFMQ